MTRADPVSEEDGYDKIRRSPEGRLWVTALASLGHDLEMASQFYGPKYAKRQQRADSEQKYRNFFLSRLREVDESIYSAWLFLYSPNSSLDIICELVGYSPDLYRRIGRARLTQVQATRRIAREGVVTEEPRV